MNSTQFWLLLAGAIIVIGYGLLRSRSTTNVGQKAPADPLAEAEVYLAYGRKEQALELLEKALRENPSRADIEAKLRDLKR